MYDLEKDIRNDKKQDKCNYLFLFCLTQSLFRFLYTKLIKLFLAVAMEAVQHSPRGAAEVESDTRIIISPHC